MCIRITTVHNLTGEKETSLFSEDNHTSNEELINDKITEYTPQENTADIDQTPDIIQIPDRLIPQRSQILTTLQSWILPGNIPRTLPLPIPPITCNSGDSMPPSNHYLQQLLETKTSNNHWGDPIPAPKPMNSFWLLSKNMNMLSTAINYLPWEAAASNTIVENKANSIECQETMEQTAQKKDQTDPPKPYWACCNHHSQRQQNQSNLSSARRHPPSSHRWLGSPCSSKRHRHLWPQPVVIHRIARPEQQEIYNLVGLSSLRKPKIWPRFK